MTDSLNTTDTKNEALIEQQLTDWFKELLPQIKKLSRGSYMIPQFVEVEEGAHDDDKNTNAYAVTIATQGAGLSAELKQFMGMAIPNSRLFIRKVQASRWESAWKEVLIEYVPDAEIQEGVIPLYAPVAVKDATLTRLQGNLRSAENHKRTNERYADQQDDSVLAARVIAEGDYAVNLATTQLEEYKASLTK